MRDIVSFCVEVLLPLALMAAIGLGGLAGLMAGWDYLDCKGFSNGTGIETRWWWGCYANVEGQWVPKDYAFGKAHELRLKEKR